VVTIFTITIMFITIIITIIIIIITIIIITIIIIIMTLQEGIVAAIDIAPRCHAIIGSMFSAASMPISQVAALLCSFLLLAAFVCPCLLLSALACSCLLLPACVCLCLISSALVCLCLVLSALVCSYLLRVLRGQQDHLPQVSGAYKVPLISPASTAAALSNKDVYPFFARTSMPDDKQALAILSVLRRYNWTTFGLM
jgi:hypothetical protein